MGLPPPPGEPVPPPPPGSYPQPGPSAHGQWNPEPRAAPPKPGPVAIRPLNLGELIDGAFKLLVANWRAIVIVTAIFVVPVQLAAAYLQRDMLGGGLLEMFTDPAAAELWFQGGGTGQNLASLLALLNSVVLVPLITGAVVAVVATSYLGGAGEAGAALAAGLRRWWALVASWLLLVIAAMLPIAAVVALLVVAGVAGLPVLAIVLSGIVLVSASFLASLVIGSLFAAAAPAIVVEQLGAVAGLRRSVRLLRPRMWPVVGTLLVATIVIFLLSVALGGIPQVAGMLVGDRIGWVLVAIGTVLSGLVTTPLLAIVVTLLYFDGRVRQEALDLRLAAAGLSSTGGDALPAGDRPGR